MRAKALEATNRFRAMFGLPLIEPDAAHGAVRVHAPGPKRPDPEDNLVHILPIEHSKDLKDFMEHMPPPILPFVGTPVRPAFAEVDREQGWVGRPSHAQRIHRFHRHHGSFLRRVHHALMALGPWEGRAVAFVLGCGIGVLLRMMWVMVLLTARAIRGPTRDEATEDNYDVVFDDEAELLVPPPQYTVIAPGGEAVPVAVADEKAEKE
ncbi:hypothetical protein C8Q77DRAFT_1063594 [Trametes polyzona]|nr:hypothetical protein C8Q77DRAFT_1063594 [Trametes polyzona]